MRLYRYSTFNTTLDVTLRLEEYIVHSKTLKGQWLADVGIPSVPIKWMSLSARHPFAHETIEAARYSFKRRKQRQLRILHEQQKRASQALNLIEQLTYDTDTNHRRMHTQSTSPVPLERLIPTSP